MIVVALLAALCCSLVYLRTSAATGRLAQDLTYDDVGYVLDAARRLDEGYEHGIAAFAATFLREPPHSPFETTLAVVGLGVLGYHDWAAYAVNAILLSAVTLFLVYAFGGERRWVPGIFVLAYLTSPMAFHTVTDFRPDMVLGFITAAFVFLFLRAALLRRRGEMTASGVLFGVALLVKPAFFAHTLAMAVGLGCIYAVLRASKRVPVIEPRQVALSLSLGLAIALPYFAIGGRTILDYFWMHSRGAQASLSSVRADLGVLDLLHRVTLSSGGPAFVLVGCHVWLFAAGALVGVAVLSVQRRWRDLVLPAGLLCAAAGSAAILVVGRMENHFFSAPFHALLMLSAFAAASLVLSSLGKRWRAVSGVALLVLTLVAVAANARIRSWDVAPDAVHGESWNEALVEAIRWDARSRGVSLRDMRALRGFVTTGGDVNAAVLEWTGRKAGLRFTFEDLDRSRFPEEILEKARGAHYVVVPSERAGIVRYLPAAAFQPALLTALSDDPWFVRVPVGVGRDTNRYVLFAQPAMLDIGVAEVPPFR